MWKLSGKFHFLLRFCTRSEVRHMFCSLQDLVPLGNPGSTNDNKVEYSIIKGCSFQIGTVAFDGEALTPTPIYCYSDRLALSIPVNIRAMEDFVNSIPLSTGGTSGESSYSKAFHAAFQYFINSYHKDDGRGNTPCYLYLSLILFKAFHLNHFDYFAVV